MIRKYQIGNAESSEIHISNNKCPQLQAEIIYDRGNWIIHNLVERNPIYINGNEVKEPTILDKYDRLNIYDETIYWSNHYYEGDKQELNLTDLRSMNGRVSRSNFRALSLLSIGLWIAIFFIPGLLLAIWQYIADSPVHDLKYESVRVILDIASSVQTFLSFLLMITIILLATKRIRDSGKPIWMIFIPIYNLKLLYFDESKR